MRFSLLEASYETVTVVRGGLDTFGDASATSEHEIADCLVFPRSSTEGLDRSDVVITGKEVLAPSGSDILATDRIRLKGEPAGSARWAVEGDVGDWQVGVQVAITKASG